VANKTTIPAVPLRTPTHTGDPTTPTLSRPWVTFYEQLVGALSGLGGLADQHISAVSLSVQGTLAIGSDLAPRVAPLNAVTAAAVTVFVKTAPTGADIVLDISYLNLKSGAWTVWMKLTLAALSTSVNATGPQITAATTLPAAAPIRLDITACGTTFPGADLTVQVYF
jgi:hypothetical protein